jgi:hypothetical protein
MNLEYMSCYESEDKTSYNQDILGRLNEFVVLGDIFMGTFDRATARDLRTVSQYRASCNNNNNNNDANAPGDLPNYYIDIVVSDDDKDNVDQLDWMEDARAFSGRSKCDATYHLLRYGPVLLASGNHKPLCRRGRSFIGRKCKHIKLF